MGPTQDTPPMPELFSIGNINERKETSESMNCEMCEKIRSMLYELPENAGYMLGSGIDVLYSQPRCSQHHSLVMSALRLDYSMSDDELYTLAKEIERLDIHKCPLNMATVITPVMHPGSTFTRPQIAALYLMERSERVEERGIGQLLNGIWIDRGLAGRWKAACAADHGGLCQGFPTKTLSTIRPSWLVDVKRQCLVPAPKDCFTLRMLLTHTSGFEYSIFNKVLLPYAKEIGSDEASPQFRLLKMPLAFNPGEDFAYGSTRDRLASKHHRDSDGTLSIRDGPFKANAEVDLNSAAAVDAVEHSGGGGLFAAPREYAKILTMLLNEGTDPRNGKQVLSKATINTVFTNRIPQFPNSSRKSLESARPDLTHEAPEFYPVMGDPPQSWGLTFMMSNGGATGRSAKTGHWAGLPNVWWWCDPETGVAGIVATQILPFDDPKVIELWGMVEAVATAAMKAH
ncbi:hypothetical protein F53441_1275 [Fusarium austroafricanum]|uniref:Beta-lactamase-related domain-containing protein n=1 Tax=Fusarium austroafricanum TaxID=2364996 RepID=A0A8H4PDG7_9HYPO|nr:hypothetical protein F53441_1275 [Fusarium austroafricanum]